MKMTYDAKAQAVYIYLTDIKPYFGIVNHTQEITDNLLIDWMKDGSILGIEVLNVATIPLVEDYERISR